MDQSRQAGDWILEREIGSGSFAKVWKATHRHTQQVAAVKEINMDKLNKKLQESLASEVAVLDHTKHHNIVCLLDLIRESNRLFIVLEFCAGGDLGHYIKRYRQVSEATARYFLQQLAEGLKELRRHNVIHRDLKPQNLLLSDSSSTPLLKIADFGFARSLAPQGLAETLCGSPLYMAPEILQFHKYDAKADLWSIGTILYELLVGKPPFNGANHMQLLRNIERGEARLPESLVGRLSGACKSLLGRLLQRNPVERITFEEFFQHPFLSGHTCPSAGVPPSQPIAAAAPAAPPAVLPAAMRQAAAAVTAAAAGPAHKASGVAVPRPSLHLHGPPNDGHHHHGYSNNPAHFQQQQQQQQQQQHLQPQPHRHWQQQQPVAATYMQQQRQLPAPPSLVQQHHQQQAADLVSHPVSHHPLAAGPSSQRDSELEAMSDSMEGDFVVVYNTTGSSAQNKSGSNSSSKASSGLVDPKAAAVLQGTAGTATGSPAVSAVSAAEQQQQQVHAAGLLGAAGGWPAGIGAGVAQHHQMQHQQHGPGTTQQLPYGPLTMGTCAAAAEPSWPWVGAAIALPPDASTSPHSLALQQPTAPQRVQLLVQVVRGCVCLITRQESGGANDAALPATQQGEQLSLLLLALQLVQALCLPESIQQHQQQGLEQQQKEEEHVAAGSLSTMLAAASQSELEQLMSGAVELLRLTKSLPGLAGSRGEGDEGLADGFAGGGGGGGGVCRMSESLLQLALPDPCAVLYQQALDSCRSAAVEEVMGNWQASMSGYSLAADLLLFLSYEWPQLGAADPGLQPEERVALHKLYGAVNGRLAAVVAEAPSAVMY